MSRAQANHSTRCSRRSKDIFVRSIDIQNGDAVMPSRVVAERRCVRKFGCDLGRTFVRFRTSSRFHGSHGIVAMPCST